MVPTPPPGTPPRPRPVTLVGWLFVLVGCGSLAAHSWRTFGPGGGAGAGELPDYAWAAGSALVAGAGGVLALRGRAEARWILLGWMAFHVVLGYLHGWEKLVVHLALFLPISFLLFRPAASAWFRSAADGTG